MSFQTLIHLPTPNPTPQLLQDVGYWVAPVVFKERIFIFYPVATQDPNNVDIAFSVSADGAKWSGEYTCCQLGKADGLNMRKRTMPCPVVYNDTLYVFFNGSGSDGTYLTTTADGLVWTSVVSMRQLVSGSMDYRDITSPSATVCSGTLFLFWINGNNAVNWAKFDGQHWGWVYPIYTSNVSIVRCTSLSVTTVKDSIYVAYAKSPMAANFTYNRSYFIFQPVANKWGPEKSLSPYGPSVIVGLTVWTTSDGAHASWADVYVYNIMFGPLQDFSSASDKLLPKARLLWGDFRETANPASPLSTFSSGIGGASFKGTSYIFWWGEARDGIWYATAPDSLPLATPAEQAHSSNS